MRVVAMLALSSALLCAAAAGGASGCPAGGCELKGATSPHYWPNKYGHAGRAPTQVSPYVGPRNLTESFLWKWTAPEGRFKDLFLGGPVVDKDKNLYMTTYAGGVVKVSPSGSTVWRKSLDPMGKSADAPALWGNGIFGSTEQGFFWGLDTATGAQLWSTDLGYRCGTDVGFVVVHLGVVVGGCKVGLVLDDYYEGDLAVVALNATTGEKMWEYLPDVLIWNTLGIFPDDETVLFQDHLGGAYRLWLFNGTLIWKGGTRVPGSFTDGGMGLGDNGMVYSVAQGSVWQDYAPNATGWVEALNVSDGRTIWRQSTPHIPNSYPVMGRIAGRSAPVLVVGEGTQFMGFYYHMTPRWLPKLLKRGIHRFLVWMGDSALDFVKALTGWEWPTSYMMIEVFDAATGERLWQWSPPPWRRGGQAGENEGFLERMDTPALGFRTGCFPGPWSSPTLDAAGRIFVGNQNGRFYALADSNGDGRIDTETEVSEYDTEADFTFAGAAVVPGMTAIMSSDTLFAFSGP